MDRLLLSLLIGIVAGIIDIIPMIIKKLPKYSTCSAFVYYLVYFGDYCKHRLAARRMVVRRRNDFANADDSCVNSCWSNR